MKKIMVLGLVLLILLIGLPLALGMGDMGPCPSCGPGDAPVTAAMCLAVLSLFVLNALFQGRSVVNIEKGLRALLVGDPPEKPPRLP
jgi:hypothetical protein